MKDKIFLCNECPIVEGYDHRLQVARELDLEPQLSYCSCDKIGLSFWRGGYCEDAWRPQTKKKSYGSRQTGRAYRRQQRCMKFDRRKAISDYGRGIGLGWLQCQNEQYFRFPKNSHKSQYYKRYSNHCVRRSGIRCGKGNAYRRVFDYWWEMY